MGQIQKITWQKREYQQKAHDRAWAEFDGGRRSTMVVMPTGTGKTSVAAKMADTMRNRDGRTLFLVHREVLVDQAAKTLRRCGLDVAIEMGRQRAFRKRGFTGHADVVCGTVQSLQGDRLGEWPSDHFGLIVTDECHRAAAPNHLNVYRHFPTARHLGLTATPEGSSGEIGNVYETKAFHYPLPVAIQEGYLVPPIHERCKLEINLKGLRKEKGDLNLGDLAERISPRVEEVADAFKQRLCDRFAVIFAPTVAVAIMLAEMLNADSPSGPGLSAKCVVGDSGPVGQSKAESKQALADFDDRKFQVLVSCDMLFEGWDAPHVSAVGIARPTLIPYRYRQMVGRGLRPCEDLGKADCIIIDFDWKTDGEARNLVVPVDLFTEDDPDLAALAPPARAAVIARARERADDGEEPREALERSKEDLRVRSTMPIYMTGRKARFQVQILDPLGFADLCGLKLKKRCDFASDRHGPAEVYQKRELQAAGIAGTDDLSFYGASKLIREIRRREKNGEADVAQIQRLLEAGVGPKTARSVTATQADAMLRLGRLD